MSDSAVPAGNGVRWLGPVLAAAVGGGAALTAVGWFAHEGPWRTAKHVPVFGVALAIVLVLAWLLRSRRIGVLPIGAVAVVVLAAVVGQLGPLAVVLWFAASSLALGRLVVRSPMATDLDCTLVGMVVHGTVVGLMVALPVNYPAVYAVLLAAPMVFAKGALCSAFERGRNWFWSPRPNGAAAWWDEAIAAAVVAITVVHFLVAAMPEFGHDALVSHLMMPLRIAWRGVWEFEVGEHVWCVMPALVDWLYTVACVLSGEAAARLVNLGSILLLGGLVFEVARWLGAERRGALVAVLLFLTTPLTLTESSSLFIEGSWAACVVGAAFAVVRACSRAPADRLPAGDPGSAHGGRELLVAGVLVGGAMAGKAVTMVSLPLLAAILAVRFRSWWRRDDRALVALAIAWFFAIGCQPYVRAWWLTGNPVFPFFNGVFRSPLFPQENFAAPTVFGKGTRWDVLFDMTFASNRYLEAAPGAAGFQWLLLVAPALLAFGLVRHRRALVLAAFAAATLWLVFAQTAYLRYVFPSFAIASALAGAAIGGALPRTWGRHALAAAAVATVTLNLICFATGGYNHVISLRALCSPSAREAYLVERQPLRAAVRLVNELGDEHHPVAMFSPAFAAELRADVLCPNWYNPRFATEVRAASTAEALGELLAARRVRHIVLSAAYEDEAARQRVREVSHEVRAIGDVSVRVLDERFRFRRELLRAGRFEDPAAWSVDPNARIEPGRGALVTVAAPAVQRVEVESGGEYRLVVRAVRAEPMTPAEARLQVNWLDARGRQIGTSIQVFACQAEATASSMDVLAPAEAAAALVYATGHTTSAVVFTELSFRQ